MLTYYIDKLQYSSYTKADIERKLACYLCEYKLNKDKISKKVILVLKFIA